MWISKREFALFEEWKGLVAEATQDRWRAERDIVKLTADVASLKSEVVRHVADKDWFKHRLNQVEQERAQLIYAATGGHGRMPGRVPDGVKVAAPQFVGEPSTSDVLNQGYNPFGDTGEDSIDPQDQIPEHVSHMPGFTAVRT